jgi:SAM-dependent methyltransferase
MRANTNRATALDFGKLVDHYDAGRAVYGPEFVYRTAGRLGIAAQARRMEVGAGTGQLTTALLAAGGQVVAVEPSAPMAERLQRNCAGEVAAGRLRICRQPFETLQPADFEPFGQLWSSDAWHWIDPLIGYRLAAGLLRPGGLLICRWRFPVLADPDLQRRLNRLYSRLSPDLVRDPVTHISQIEPLLAQGRQQVNDSGYMTTVDYWAESARDDIAVSAYVDLQLSFAHTAGLTPDQRAELAQGIRDVVGQRHSPAKISLATWQYTCASQPVMR